MASPAPSNKRASDAAGSTEALCIVLVGRTGLEAALRRDPGVELAHVRSALEAVGELSKFIADGSRRNVVILASDADPAASPVRDAGGPANIARSHDFLTALRDLDKNVRILRLEDAQGAAPQRAGYDGVITADSSPEVLRALIRGTPEPTLEIQIVEPDAAGQPASGNGEPREPFPAPRHTPRPLAPNSATAAPTPPAPTLPASTPADPAASSQAAAPPLESHAQEDIFGPSRSAESPVRPEGLGAGDEDLVRLLLQGRDIVDAAAAIIRRRLGGRDIIFTTSGRDGGSPGAAGSAAPEEGAAEVSVSWRGRLLGRLRGVGVSAPELLAHASWLGSWLSLRDQHAQLRDAAFTDSLTGAYNRRFFDHFLGVAIEQARRERRPLTLLMFDLDDFKQYNDHHGHAAGDEILTETVKLLRSLVRPSDKVCRIGGDEFVVIFHEPTGPRSSTSRHPSDIYEVAHRFRDAIAAHRFPKLGREAPGTLTISGGLATYPWDGNSPETLLARADELALQSKRQGKNVITLGPGAEREHGGK
jgi:two-component system cell cycle response regulator